MKCRYFNSKNCIKKGKIRAGVDILNFYFRSIRGFMMKNFKKMHLEYIFRVIAQKNIQ